MKNPFRFFKKKEPCSTKTTDELTTDACARIDSFIADSPITKAKLKVRYDHIFHTENSDVEKNVFQRYKGWNLQVKNLKRQNLFFRIFPIGIKEVKFIIFNSEKTKTPTVT